MAAKKKINDNFLTKQIKDDLKNIISDVVNKNRNLTSADIDVLTIKKTANGYVLEYNDGTPTEPPTVEVIQTDEMDGGEDIEMYREGLLDLLYNVAIWSGYEHDEKRKDNLSIDFNLVGDEATSTDSDSDYIEEDDDKENFKPPTKEEILAAAMGKETYEEEIPQDDEEDDGVRYEEDLPDNEYVAGEDYSVTEDELDDDDDSEGYNEDFEEYYDDDDSE